MNLSISSPEFQAEYLQTLPSIRERCGRVYALAQQGKLEYFDYRPEREAAVVEYCAKIIQRDFGSKYDSIPPHSRWQHFSAGGVDRIQTLRRSWASSSPPPDVLETTKRLIDLCLVSVLLDAGAGDRWVYQEAGSNLSIGRSEGLAIASLRAFENGLFSGDKGQPYRVDAPGLSKISIDRIAIALQVDSVSNPLNGLEGRSTMLASLGSALSKNPEFFGDEGRPGNMIDFLLKNSIPPSSPSEHCRVDVSLLFHVLIHGLGSIWPDRMSLAGVALGDVWPCRTLESTLQSSIVGETLVPFHKLTQWLTYSLVVPLQQTLGWVIEGMEHLTGLPEYRNGGLFLDQGVLVLRRDKLLQFYSTQGENAVPRLSPSHDAIIEWRAMTVILLDRIAEALRTRLGAPTLSLPQVLESATWKGGREIAKEKRPPAGGPPIDIESDGTVF